jgi:hypothetical protein
MYIDGEWVHGEYTDIEKLLGKTIVKIGGDLEEEIHFHTDEGETYVMYHDQNCCESVTVEDITGYLEDLIGSPLTMAEETSNSDEGDEDSWESETWTYYKLATVKGYVTIRWYGTSNGYYSESVDFIKLDNEGDNE